MTYDIYLSPPHMGGDERLRVGEAFDGGWIAPCGPSLNRFEAEMARYAGRRSALAVSSGTAALHLTLRYLGAGPGDSVFCSDLTFIGSCVPILYESARPVFIDSEPESFNMSPDALHRALEDARREGRLPKAVVIVDLYGESADYGRLLPLCRALNVPVVEDAAEAVGADCGGRRCGGFGDAAVFSFNGNKIITTSGGGMVLSDDPEAIARMRFWAAQAREPFPHYEHRDFGYNYRMSNVCAAIGLGQLSFLAEKLERRRRIFERYEEGLAGLPVTVKRPSARGTPNHWLSLLRIDDPGVTPPQAASHLAGAGIEARPAWKPMHLQPLFAGCRRYAHDGDKFVSEDVFDRCLCLPSGDGMTDAQQDRVIGRLRELWS